MWAVWGCLCLGLGVGGVVCLFCGVVVVVVVKGWGVKEALK